MGEEGPEALGLEALDLVEACHAEAQRGCLAGTVRDQRRVEVPVLALKVLRLEPNTPSAQRQR